MNKLILIKYGELFTKKGNRNLFINALYQDIKNKLKDVPHQINKQYLRMTINYNEQDEKKITDALDHTFGISSYTIAEQVNSNEEDIKEALIPILKDLDFKTFKIDVKRNDKNFPIKSTDFAKQLGGLVLKNIPNLKVDLHHPELLCVIEILPKVTYIYTKKVPGLGGYPLSTLGKGLLMLSGGIDSPVAGYLAQKRGMKLSAIYFESLPHTSIEAREKVLELAKKLTNYGSNIDVHIINFTKLQEEIYKQGDPAYTITIMRRMMYRISEIVAMKYKIPVIVNGESVGQVASQTLTSLNIINEVTNMPVIRPVVTMDKTDIIKISKEIDTYDISILPFEDCCTIFVPKNPVIHPKLSICYDIESRFDYESFIDEIMLDIKTITIKQANNNEFEDIL